MTTPASLGSPRCRERQRKGGARLACLLAGLVALIFSTVSLPVLAAEPAPAKERLPLLPLAQPLWNDLSPSQRETLAPLAANWNALPLAKKRSWLSLTEKMPSMMPEDRAKAQARIREWASLTPDQRRMARNNYRLAKSLDRDERLATWESYNQMTPEQQSVLRANGWTSNTAAKHAGAPTGLAKEAARPITAVPAAKVVTRPRSTGKSAAPGETADTPSSAD